MLIEMRTATITEKGQISIPKSIRQKFKSGKVAVLAFENRIELRPFENISESMETMIASESALAKDWLSPEEDEAWAHLQEEK